MGLRDDAAQLVAWAKEIQGKGSTAAMDELTQLHMMDMWTAMDLFKLAQEDHVKVLSSLLFLREKQSEKIKGSACINGAPQ
jgi:hypothetical protein